MRLGCLSGQLSASSGLLRQRQEWSSGALSLLLKSWVRSERSLIPPRSILVREKTSLSFDMIIESNLPCPLLDFAYVSRIADGRTQTQTGVWTKKRRSIQEALPKSSNITGVSWKEEWLTRGRNIQ